MYYIDPTSPDHGVGLSFLWFYIQCGFSAFYGRIVKMLRDFANKFVLMEGTSFNIVTPFLREAIKSMQFLSKYMMN